MSISTDWLLLFLRLVFVVVLYFFLYQIVRLTTRELAILAQHDATSQASRRVIGRLVVVDPAETVLPVGTGFALTTLTLVGRRPGSDIVLDDSFVSAEHAELEVADQGWLLRDLGSTNGTFVNGHEVVGTTAVGDGDVVQFGRVKLKLVC
jgi:pSer/pThr/pTyr-binding forkhead associated (FHA) protein